MAHLDEVTKQLFKEQEQQLPPQDSDPSPSASATPPVDTETEHPTESHNDSHPGDNKGFAGAQGSETKHNIEYVNEGEGSEDEFIHGGGSDLESVDGGFIAKGMYRAIRAVMVIRASTGSDLQS